MKTKEQLIKEAYGEYWETVKDMVDENGWIFHKNVVKGFKKYVSPFDIGFIEIKDDEAEAEKIQIHPDSYKSSTLFYWRPEALRGIETNNGWIKIESEDDLPKDEENLNYWVMEDEQIVHAKFMPESKRWYCDIDLNLRLFPSHYQPMVKPKPPIY